MHDDTSGMIIIIVVFLRLYVIYSFWYKINDSDRWVCNQNRVSVIGSWKCRGLRRIEQSSNFFVENLKLFSKWSAEEKSFVRIHLALNFGWLQVVEQKSDLGYCTWWSVTKYQMIGRNKTRNLTSIPWLTLSHSLHFLLKL